MSTEREQPRRWSTLSYAHENPELRKDNPLYERAGSASRGFAPRASGNEPERIVPRDSDMVKRQQPRSVLRPSRELSYGPDGAAFDRQWREEWRQARKHNQGRGRD